MGRAAVAVSGVQLLREGQLVEPRPAVPQGPILMTSFAFLLGVVPLVLASGAGAASRKSLGTAVFGGMLLSTFVNLIFIPVLYTLVESARSRLLKRREV